MNTSTMTRLWFAKPKPAPEAEPWPTKLNPCTNPEHWQKKSCHWNVKGYTTRLCSQCVWDKECEMIILGGGNEARRAALNTFNPDLDGAPCVPDVG